MRLGKAKNVFHREQGMTVSFSFCSAYIDAIGYDAQRALLEVWVSGSGRIRRYIDVPEEVWYRFRESACPDIYYRRCICGHFRESAVRNSVRGTVLSRKKMPLDKNKNMAYAVNENDYQNRKQKA